MRDSIGFKSRDKVVGKQIPKTKGSLNLVIQDPVFSLSLKAPEVLAL